MKNNNANPTTVKSGKNSKSITPTNKNKNNLLFSNDNKIIGQFIIGEKLGEGTFSKVYSGTHITTNEKVTNILHN
jgi:hypothetical protein